MEFNLNDKDIIKNYHNDINKDDSIYKLSEIYLNLMEDNLINIINGLRRGV